MHVSPTAIFAYIVVDLEKLDVHDLAVEGLAQDSVQLSFVKLVELLVCKLDLIISYNSNADLNILEYVVQLLGYLLHHIYVLEQPNELEILIHFQIQKGVPCYRCYENINECFHKIYNQWNNKIPLNQLLNSYNSMVNSNRRSNHRRDTQSNCVLRPVVNS